MYLINPLAIGSLLPLCGLLGVSRRRRCEHRWHRSDLVTILEQTLTALLPFKIKVLNLLRLILRNRVAYVLTNRVTERRLLLVLHPLI